MDFSQLSTQAVTVIGISLATLGWVWSTKRARSLSRKQHTFNALLQSRFNQQYQSAHVAVRPFVRGEKKIDLLQGKNNKKIVEHLTFLLNHYEFLSAGVRNGDISEQLLKDSQKGVIVALFEYSEGYIESLRNNRHRQSLFEHLEWLYMRWKGDPPSRTQRICEVLAARPLYHQYYQWFFLGPLLLMAGVLLGLYISSFEGYPATPTPPPASPTG